MNSPVDDIFLEIAGKYGEFGDSRRVIMLGATAITGNCADRLNFTIARASRKRASPPFRFRFPAVTYSSRAFN
jgi:hypothetical protein